MWIFAVKSITYINIVSMIISETIIDLLLYHNLWVSLLPIFVESTASFKKLPTKVFVSATYITSERWSLLVPFPGQDW